MLESILATKFVDIVSVHTNVSRSKFSQDEIEKLARNFLLSGGSTKPLIVRPKNAEEFDIIEGNLEFYAALRAKEIDDNFEMIQAIIIDSKNEKVVLEQVNLLKEGVDPLPPYYKVIERIKNLEEQLSSDINNLKTQFDTLRNELIREKFTQEIANRVAKLIIPPPPPPVIELNTASKSDLLTVPGIGKQKALDIIKRRETKKFQSIEELTEIKNITSKMIKDKKWNEWFFINKTGILS
jgi:predicted DNA-binding helix-hairpin-helix protein